MTNTAAASKKCDASRAQSFFWLLSLSLFLIATTPLISSALPAEKQPSKSNQAASFRDTHLTTLGVAREDAAYRYLAEKGAELFRNGRFAEAEKYYRAALTNAEHDGIHDRRLAMLVTNLATDLRQQQRYEESEPLFERAVEIERRLVKKDNELMIYTAKQYAALLRETARDASGEAIIASAHNSFNMMPSVQHNAPDDSEKNVVDVEVEKTDKRLRMRSAAEDNSQALFQNPSSTISVSNLNNPQLNVMAELKILADIEHGYMSDSLPQSQILPSNFSYLNSGPLYSSPGFTGAYLPVSGGGLHMRIGGHYMGGGGGHHR